MADIIVFEKYKRKTKRGKGGMILFKHQLENILFGMELKRYRAKETLQEILEVIERRNLPFDNPTIQKHLKILFLEISSLSQGEDIITIELLEKAFQNLDAFIVDCQIALKRFEGDLKSNTLKGS